MNDSLNKTRGNEEVTTSVDLVIMAMTNIPSTKLGVEPRQYYSGYLIAHSAKTLTLGFIAFLVDQTEACIPCKLHVLIKPESTFVYLQICNVLKL